MRPALRRVLDAHDGVVSTAELTIHLGPHVAARAGRVSSLVRVFPHTYVDAATKVEPALRYRAALRYAGAGAALSHLTALDVWGLPVPACDVVHLTTDRSHRLRASPGVQPHRRDGFRTQPPDVVLRRGLRVVRLERAIVESWPLLLPSGAGQLAAASSDQRRAPAIVAVQGRLTTAPRLAAVLGESLNLPGRAELAALLEMLADGRHSELEIWGHRHVFAHPSLPTAVAQHPVRLPGRTVYLDNAYLDEMVDVELDGAADHSEEQRAADLRRDTALAALGWLTMRFSGARLRREPDACRAEVLAALEVRRRWRTGVA